MIDSQGTGMVWLERSEVKKVKDALALAWRFFKSRDEMNAQVHSASDTRYSPITSRMEAELQRVRGWLAKIG